MTNPRHKSLPVCCRLPVASIEINHERPSTEVRAIELEGTAAKWVSIAWFWSDASDLLWSVYGVSSRIGRFMDKRGGIPLGRIALDEFEMLGEEQPHGSHGVNRFDLPPVSARPTHRLSAKQHAALGMQLRRALQQLSRPWPFAKSHRRSVCRNRLRLQVERLQSMASGFATREHGDDFAHSCYYVAGASTSAKVPK